MRKTFLLAIFWLLTSVSASAQWSLNITGIPYVSPPNLTRDILDGYRQTARVNLVHGAASPATVQFHLAVYTNYNKLTPVNSTAPGLSSILSTIQGVAGSSVNRLIAIASSDPVTLTGPLTYSKSFESFWSEYNFSSSYAPELESKLNAGQIMEGTHAVYVWVTEAGGAPLAYDGRIYTVSTPSPPSLLFPTDGRTLLARTTPDFRWTPVSTSYPIPIVLYRLRIVEVLNGQSAVQAMKTNRIYYEATTRNITQHRYDLSLPELLPNRAYAWQVESLDGTEEPLSSTYQSEIFTFITPEDGVSLPVTIPDPPKTKAKITLTNPQPMAFNQLGGAPLNTNFLAKVSPIASWSDLNLEAIRITDPDIDVQTLRNPSTFETYWLAGDQGGPSATSPKRIEILESLVSFDGTGTITLTGLTFPQIGVPSYVAFRYTGKNALHASDIPDELYPLLKSEVGIAYLPSASSDTSQPKIEIVRPSTDSVTLLQAQQTLAIEAKFTPVQTGVPQGGWRNVKLQIVALTETGTTGANITTQTDFDALVTKANNGDEFVLLHETAHTLEQMGELRHTSPPFPELGKNYWVVYRLVGELGSSENTKTFTSAIGRIEVQTIPRTLSLAVDGFTPRATIRRSSQDFSVQANPASLLSESSVSTVIWYKEVTGADSTMTGRQRAFNELSRLFSRPNANPSIPSDYTEWMHPIDASTGNGTMRLPIKGKNAIVVYRLVWDLAGEKLYSAPIYLYYNGSLPQFNPEIALNSPSTGQPNQTAANSTPVTFSGTLTPFHAGNNNATKGIWRGNDLRIEAIRITDPSITPKTITTQASFDNLLTQAEAGSNVQLTRLSFPTTLEADGSFSGIASNLTANIGVDYRVVFRVKGVISAEIGDESQDQTAFSPLGWYEVKAVDPLVVKVEGHTQGARVQETYQRFTFTYEESTYSDPQFEGWYKILSPQDSSATAKRALINTLGATLGPRPASPALPAGFTPFSPPSYTVFEGNYKGFFGFPAAILNENAVLVYRISVKNSKGQKVYSNPISLVYQKEELRLEVLTPVTQTLMSINGGSTVDFKGKLVPAAGSGMWKNPYLVYYLVYDPSLKPTDVNTKQEFDRIRNLVNDGSLSFPQRPGSKYIGLSPNVPGEVQVLGESFPDIGQDYWVLYQFGATYDKNGNDIKLESTFGKIQVKSKGSFSLNVSGYQPRLQTAVNALDFTFDYNADLWRANYTFQLEGFYKELFSPDEASPSNKDALFNTLTTAMAQNTTPAGFSTWTQTLSNPATKSGQMMLPSEWLGNSIVGFRLKASNGYYTFYTQPAIFEYQPSGFKPRLSITQPMGAGPFTATAGPDFVSFTAKPEPVFPADQRATKGQWESITLETVTVYDPTIPSNTIKSHSDFEAFMAKGKGWSAFEHKVTSFEETKLPNQYADFQQNATLAFPAYRFARLGQDYWVAIRFKGIFVRQINGLPQKTTWYSDLAHYEIKEPENATRRNGLTLKNPSGIPVTKASEEPVGDHFAAQAYPTQDWLNLTLELVYLTDQNITPSSLLDVGNFNSYYSRTGVQTASIGVSLDAQGNIKHGDLELPNLAADYYAVYRYVGRRSDCSLAIPCGSDIGIVYVPKSTPKLKPLASLTSHGGGQNDRDAGTSESLTGQISPYLPGNTDNSKGVWKDLKLQVLTSKDYNTLFGDLDQRKKDAAFYQGAFTKLVNTAKDPKSGLNLTETPIIPDASGNLNLSQLLPEQGHDYWVAVRFAGNFVSERNGVTTEQSIATSYARFLVKTKATFSIAVEGYRPNMVLNKKTQDFSINSTILSQLTEVKLNAAYQVMPDNAEMAMSSALIDLKSATEGVIYNDETLPATYKTWTQPLTDFASGKGKLVVTDTTLFRAALVYWVSAKFNGDVFKSNPIFLDLKIPRPEPKYVVIQTYPKPDATTSADAGSTQSFRIKTTPWDVYNDQKVTDKWDRVSMQVVYVWDDFPTNVVTTQEEFNKLFNEKEIRGTAITKMRTEEINARWLINGELEVPSYTFQEMGRDYWAVIRFKGVYLKGTNAFGTGNKNESFSKPVHFKIKTKATFSASMKSYKKRMTIRQREQAFTFEADPPSLLKNVELIGLFKNLAPEDTTAADVLAAFRKMEDAFDEMEEDADESPDGFQSWIQPIPNLALKSGTMTFPDQTTERAVVGFVLRGNVNGAEIYTDPILLDYNLPSPSNRIFTVKTKVEVKDAQNVAIAAPEWDKIKPELNIKIGRQTKSFKPSSFKDGNLVFAFKLPVEVQPTNKGAAPLPFTVSLDGDVSYTSAEATGMLNKKNVDVPTMVVQARKAGEYFVSGTVKDSDSDPVPSIELKIAVEGVTTPQANVKSDASGKFKFTVKLPAGKIPTTKNTVNFTILPVLTPDQKLLYKPSSENGALDGRDQNKLLLKLKSLNAAVIAGTLVSKGAKKPVRMAEVEVYEAKNLKHRLKKVMTDEDGKFLAVGLLEGEYVLKIEKTGYKTLTKYPPTGSVKVETGKKADVKEVQMELKPLTVQVSVRPKKGPITQEPTVVYAIKKTDLNQYQEWRETNPLARFATSGLKVVQKQAAKLNNKPVNFTFNDVDIERAQDSYIFISSSIDLNDALGEQTTPMDSVITIRQTAYPSIYLKGKVLKQGATTGLAGIPLKLTTKQTPPKVFTAKTDENGLYNFCLGGMTAMDCSAAIRDFGFTVEVVIAPKVLTSKDPAPPDKALYSWTSPDVDFVTDVPDFKIDAKWVSGGANPTTPLPRPKSNTVWSTEEPEIEGKVKIKVRSAGQAVAGATVAFGDNEADTDGNGEVSFDKVGEDSYDLTITAPDGANYSVPPTSVRVTYSSRSNPIFEITQDAQTGMVVSGQVLDQDNKPVSKATIYVKGMAHISAVTKEDGTYSLAGVVGIKAGSSLLDPVLVADAEGYGLEEQTIAFQAGQSKVGADFKVNQADITEIYGFRVKYKATDLTKTASGWTIKTGSLINIPSNARVKFDKDLELPFNNLSLNAQKRPTTIFSLSISEVAVQAFGFNAKIFSDTGLLLVQEDTKTKKGYIKGKIQFQVKEAFQGHTFNFMVSDEPWPAPAKCDDTALCITAGENLLGGALEYEKGEDFQFGSASGQKVTQKIAPGGKSHFLQDAPISIIGTRIDEDGVSYSGRFKLPELETGVKVDMEAFFSEWGFNPKKRTMKFPNIDDAEASIEHEASGRFLHLMISNLKLYDDGFYLEEGSAIFNASDSRTQGATGDVTEGYEFTFRDCMLRTKNFAFRVGELEIPNNKALTVAGMALSVDRIGFGYEEAFYFRIGGGLTLPKVNNAVAINELGYDGRTKKITMDLGLTQPINVYSMKLSVERLEFNYSFSTKAVKLGFEGAVSFGSVMTLGGAINLERKNNNWDFQVEKITGKATLGPVDVEDISITLKDGTVGGGFKASVMKKFVFGASFMWKDEQNFAFSGTFGTPIPFGAWTFERATLSVSRAFSTWNVGMTDVAFSSGGRNLTVKGGINVTFGGGSTIIKVTGEVLLYQETTQIGKAEVVIDTEVGITGSVKMTGFSDPALREMVEFKREPTVSFAVIWGGTGEKYWYFGGGLDVKLAKLIDASAYVFIGENADGLLSQASSIAEKFSAHPKGKLSGIYAGGIVGASFKVWPISASGGVGMYFMGDINTLAGGFYYALNGGVDLFIVSGSMGFALVAEMNKTKGQALYVNGSASVYVQACINLLIKKVCKKLSIGVYARTENGSIKYGLKW